MIIAYLFLLVALVFIFVEFFLPGGILGAFGGLLCLVALIIQMLEASHAWEIILFVFVEAATVALVIFFALRWLRMSKRRSSFYSEGDQGGYKAVSSLQNLIGKEGETKTICSPSGYVMIEGQRYSAVSQSGYLALGEKVRVVDEKSGYLVVEKLRS